MKLQIFLADTYPCFKMGIWYAKHANTFPEIKDAYLSKLFGRMANILSSGEPEKNFSNRKRSQGRSIQTHTKGA